MTARSTISFCLLGLFHLYFFFLVQGKEKTVLGPGQVIKLSTSRRLVALLRAA